MMRSGATDRVRTVLIGSGLGAFGLAWLQPGLEVQPGKKGLYLALSALLIATVLALAERSLAGRKLPVRALTAVACWGVLLVMGFVAAGLYLQDLTLLRFDNRLKPTQTNLVVMPIWLPEKFNRLMEDKGRQHLVETYEPEQIEFYLAPHTVRRVASTFATGLVYASTFATVAAVGAALGLLWLPRPGGPPLARCAPAAAASQSGTRWAAFVCHASQDAEAAAMIRDHLERQGIACWMAPRNVRPGENWPKAVLQGLASSEVLLLVHSRQANESVHVINEVNEALARRKQVIPVKLDDEPPTDELQFLTGVRQWSGVGDPPAPEQLEALVASLRTVLPRPNDPTALAPSSPHEGTMPARRAPER